jgi:hypothetical protein
MHSLAAEQRSQTQKKPAGIVMILYQQPVSNISRLLTKYHIKTIRIPVKKSIHMLRPIKDV